MDAQEFIEYKNIKLKANPFMYTKDIGQKGRHKWKVVSRTMMIAEDLKQKVFTFERIEYVGLEGQKFYKAASPEVQYRIGYYIIGRNGKWIWGQYTPMISSKDLVKLMTLAKKEGTFIDTSSTE